MSAKYRTSVGSEDEEHTKQVRGPQLVANVLEATLAELARAGYEHLSVEQVAERARVNKVTIYRRWPTKRDLVRTALRHVADEHSTPADTGTLRGDLLALLRSVKELANSPTGRALLHLLFVGAPGDELVQLAKSISREKDEEVKVIYSRAVEREQLPPNARLDLVHSLLVGATLNACVFQQNGLDDRDLPYVVDLVLAGLMALERPRRKNSKAKASPLSGKGHGRRAP